MPPQHHEFEQAIAEQFQALPQVVQDAILSADTEARLRELSDKHKLHVDKWGALQDQVMLALLGIRPAEDLQKNIRESANIPDETAAALASDISQIIFEPIRQELERELEHPEAKDVEKSDVEEARSKLLESSAARNAPAPTPAPVLAPQPAALATPVIAATPPPAPPTEKVVRAPASGAYKPGEASAVRKDVRDDPYREAPV